MSDQNIKRYADSWIGFDELQIGDVFESAARTVTQAEVTLFAGVSGDFNPIHMDHVFRSMKMAAQLNPSEFLGKK